MIACDVEEQLHLKEAMWRVKTETGNFRYEGGISRYRFWVKEDAILGMWLRRMRSDSEGMQRKIHVT